MIAQTIKRATPLVPLGRGPWIANGEILGEGSIREHANRVTMATGRALIVGDLYTLSREQEQFLESLGIELVHASATNTLARSLEEIFDLAIAGVTASGPDLDSIVKELHRQDPELPIILIADDVRMRDAYVLGQSLAYDCIPRIVENGWLAHKVKLAIMQRQLLLEVRALSLANGDTQQNESMRAEPALAAHENTLETIEPGDMYQSSERRVILEALAKTRWNRRKAARLLGISYNTLRRRIDRYHLNSTYPL